MKKVVVVGASGATGRLVVANLLQQDVQVIAIVRASSSMSGAFEQHANCVEVAASIGEMPDDMLSPLLDDCDAVISCLGHNLSFKGMFGEPRRLVTNAVTRISKLIEASAPETKVKLILMNTTGNSNRDVPETPPWSQRAVVFVLRYLLPPHADNEQAADFLRTQVGQRHAFIEWAAVRPDALVDAQGVTEYAIHPSPTRNAIFNAGATSRINVAHFMANLVIDAALWDAWKGKMPVIYNREQ